MAENKTKPTQKSVADFIAKIENKRRKDDAKIALKLYQEITGLVPIMWGPSIIGFGIRHYEYESGRKGSVPAAAFSPRKANMTFYIDNDFKDAEKLFNKLGKHKKSVACLYINKLDDIDMDTLRKIIQNDYAKSNQE